jgi:hypothetical protein
MGKIVLMIMVLLVSLSGCQVNEKPEVNSIKENLVYFKDDRTGLCFAAVNSTNTKSLSNSTSISCVPCDSLKNVEIK